jgi:hypothetical protein
MATKEQWDEIKELGTTADNLEYYAKQYPKLGHLHSSFLFFDDLYRRKLRDRNLGCCDRCDGKGTISNGNDPNDHNCPHCNGKGQEDLGGEND